LARPPATGPRPRWPGALSPLLAVLPALLALAPGATPAAALSRDAAGSRVVAYSGVQVRVPAQWPVYDLAVDPTRCARTDRHAVYLGHQGTDAACPAQVVGRTEAAHVEPLDAAVAVAAALATTRRVAGGLGVRLDPAAATAHSLVAAVDGPGVLLTISYGRDEALAQAILGSLAAAPSTGAASTGPRTAIGAAPPAVTRSGRAVRARQPFAGAGFDTCGAPSARAMQAWLGSPFGAVGIYVGGANRACPDGNLSASWIGRVADMGWSLMPLYVGLQAPCAYQGGLATIDPGSAYLQGAQAADDAATRAQGFGLGAGSVLFFDMEAYDPGCRATVDTFLTAWSRQLHGRGYRSGVYSSVDSGIRGLVADTAARPDAIWLARWDGVATTGDPAVPDALWSGHQRVKQYSGGHTETYAGVTIDVDSDLCDVDLGATVTPRPLEEFIPDNLGGHIWNAYQQTAATGAAITGRPAAWTDAAGLLHVAVRGTAADLVEFVPDGSGGHIWNAYDLTSPTGASISGDPAAWSDPGRGGHVYVQGGGRLLEFAPDAGNARAWSAHARTAGGSISGRPAVWTDAGGRPHVYVRGAADNLLELIPDGPGGAWNAYDQTASTGSQVAGDPAIWSDGRRPHVYVPGPANDLLEFIPDNLGGRIWNAYDQTAYTGAAVAGSPFAWSAGGAPHVYVRGNAGNLLEFIPDNLGGRIWHAYDQTAYTGAPVSGDPSAWTDAGGAPHVYVRGIADNLVEFIPDNVGGRVWHAYDQTASTGVAISGDPCAWSPGAGAPHVYVAGD
jgi:hypothetical protein